MEHKPGIYFNVPFEDYLAIEALSSSGIKDFLGSPYRFWSNSWMNLDKEEEQEEKKHNIEGRAYHARICEGEEAFNQRYVPAFDPSLHPDALDKSDELKQWLREAKEAGHEVKLTGVKQDLAGRILDIDSNVQIMDNLRGEYAVKHAGKEFLPEQLAREIEIAAHMVSLHPDACKAFQGGYPEVTILWRDEIYDIPMKARFDYLKIQAVVDLKTFDNSFGRNIERIPANEVAKYRYHIQAGLYLQAAGFAKQFAKDGLVYGDHDSEWLKKFANEKKKPVFLFVFLQKGLAEIRGKILSKSMTLDCANVCIQGVKEDYFNCMEKYGTDSPWIEPKHFDSFCDEDFPIYMTEA